MIRQARRPIPVNPKESHDGTALGAKIELTFLGLGFLCAVILGQHLVNNQIENAARRKVISNTALNLTVDSPIELWRKALSAHEKILDDLHQISDSRPQSQGLKSRKTDNPIFRGALYKSMQIDLNRRYSSLLGKLALDPAKENRVVQSLTNRTLGIVNEDTRLIDQATDAELETFSKYYDSEIQSILTPSEFSIYLDYQRRLPAINLMNSLQNMVCAVDGGLNADQVSTMMDALAVETKGISFNDYSFLPSDKMEFAAGTANQQISDELLTKMSTVLTPSQMAALQEIHDLQIAKRKLAEATRSLPGASDYFR